MATGEQATALPGAPSFGTWTSWLAALFGLWVVISPFALQGEIGAAPALYSNVVAGLAILVLAAYGAYWIRSSVASTPFSVSELAGWVAAIVGLWIAISPWVLAGEFSAGTPLYSTVVAGLIAFVLAVFAGWEIHTTE